MYTQELTRLLYDDLTMLTGRSPTMVINLLARVKLDANRDINEATFGEEVAIEAWEEFHRFTCKLVAVLSCPVTYSYTFNAM